MDRYTYRHNFFVQLTKKNFLILLALVTVTRALLALWIPIKNDEAYYVLWAQHLEFGYYDHPPMIGWVIWLMSQVSGSLFWFRILPIVAVLVATWGVYRLAAQAYGVSRARLGAVLFALSPSSLWMIFFSNDAPLLIFLTFSVVLFGRAVSEKSCASALASGFFLGLAFLAKYLAVIVGIGYLLFALLRDQRRRLVYVVLVLTGVLPFAAQHVYYNYFNCWNTVNFHLFVRNADTGFGFTNFFSYLVGLVMVITPWVVWVLAKQRKKLPRVNESVLSAIVFTSVTVFALISLKSIIGLHFLLVFSPYVYVLVAGVYPDRLQKKLITMSLAYAVLLVGVLVGLLLYPLDKMKGWEHHSNFVVGLAPEEVCKPLDKYRNLPMFSNYYAQAGILDFTCKRNIGVLFGWSNYGREMDSFIDVRSLEGKKIAILELGELDPEKYRQYFSDFRVDRFTVREAPFSVIIGENFNYRLYRDNILSKLDSMYYSPPDWLPAAGCPFREKYFGDKETAWNRKGR